MLILASRPLSLWFGASLRDESGNTAERSPLDQIFFFSVLCTSLLVALSRRIKWGKLFSQNKLLIVFYLFFAISICWSGDPAGSTKRLTKDFGLLFVAAILLSEKRPFDAIRAMYVRCAAVLLPLSVVLIRYFPQLGRDYTIAGEPMVTGVTIQKNNLGEITLIFGIFLLWDCLEFRDMGPRRSWKNVPWDKLVLLVLAIYLLWLSQSKTSLIALLISIFLIVRSGTFNSRKVSWAVLCSALSLPFLMFFAQQLRSIISPLVEAAGRNMTFTGRTDIWAHINLYTVNPWIGAGYWNFWGGVGGEAISNAMRTPIPNAHCGYMDMYLDGGILGLIVLFIFLLGYGTRLIASQRASRYAKVRFAVLIALIFCNLFETTFARIGPIWFTTLLMILEFPFRKAASARPVASPAAVNTNDVSERILAGRTVLSLPFVNGLEQ